MRITIVGRTERYYQVGDGRNDGRETIILRDKAGAPYFIARPTGPWRSRDNPSDFLVASGIPTAQRGGARQAVGMVLGSGLDPGVNNGKTPQQPGSYSPRAPGGIYGTARNLRISRDSGAISDRAPQPFVHGADLFPDRAPHHHTNKTPTPPRFGEVTPAPLSRDRFGFPARLRPRPDDRATGGRGGWGASIGFDGQ